MLTFTKYFGKEIDSWLIFSRKRSVDNILLSRVKYLNRISEIYKIQISKNVAEITNTWVFENGTASARSLYAAI